MKSRVDKYDGPLTGLLRLLNLGYAQVPEVPVQLVVGGVPGGNQSEVFCKPRVRTLE
jgi:hypothetical protein